MSAQKISHSETFDRAAGRGKWVLASLTPVKRGKSMSGMLLRIPQEDAIDAGWTKRVYVRWFSTPHELYIECPGVSRLTPRIPRRARFGKFKVTKDRKNAIIYIAWRKLYMEPWPQRVWKDDRDVTWAKISPYRGCAWLSLDKYTD
jgi:hypothetical protein